MSGPEQLDLIPEGPTGPEASDPGVTPSPAPARAAPAAASPAPAPSAAKPLPRHLILASAGSGKTYRISSRIIALIAAGHPPESVFASTFTRKAAGEILDRVLVRMAAAALDDGAAAELAGAATLDEGSPPPADRAFWSDVLRRVARQLHRMDVGTLDAFFVRAITSFGHDIGLPPRWSIADTPTADRIRSEALQEVLAKTDEGARVELVRGLAGDTTRRSVHDALLEEVDDILRVHHAIAPGSPGWGALRAAVGPRPPDLAARRRDLAERIAAVEPPENKSGGQSSGWVRALSQASEAVASGDWAALLGKGIGCKVIVERATDFSRHPIPLEVATLFEEAAALARADLGPTLAARAEAQGRLAELYCEAFDRRLREGGALRFEDLTRLLGGEALCARPDLFYRLDGRTLHLLLDEFQDTSLPQWAALEPLADALMADRDPGRAALIVADPKQSIYGWRGAAPVVVHHVGDRYALEPEVMAKSWRSSQVVLDAVNAIFRDLDAREVLGDDEAARAVAADWLRDFAPHDAMRDRPGHVRLLAGPPKQGRSQVQPDLCRHAAVRIAELRREAPGRSIGVLVRTNATVARLIHELRLLEVPASEEGGTPLTDSAAVASVLALLRLADHPGDSLARYHVAKTPVGAAVGLIDAGDARGAARVAARFRRRLLEDGYGLTLGRLADRLEPACDARERARLRQLVALGYRHDGRPSLRVTDFVRVVEAERVEAPSSADVRVMTVHQSKGLEFDTVVLPDLDVSLTRGGGGGPPLAYRPEPAGPVTHVFPPIPKDVRPLFADVPEIEAAHAQARAAELRDALSNLYVASTRARHALHMIVAADGEKGQGTAKTYARLVREALALDMPAAEGDVLFEAGDPAWHSAAGGPTGSPEAEPPPAPDVIRLRDGGPRRRMLGRRAPHEMEGGPNVDVRRVLGLTKKGEHDPEAADAARDRGTVTHAWLERLAWAEEGLPPAEELRRIARGVAPGMPESAVAEAEAWLRDRLARPEVGSVLARDGYGTEVRLERELPFLHREGDVLIEGVIDRLVLTLEDGRVARAEIIDYKTDALPAGDEDALVARVEHYAPQLRAYARAVAGMHGLEPAQVTARLAFLEVGAVREVRA